MVKNGIDVSTEQEVSPSFYWVPKLHKTPYGTRLIATSNKCTTKELSYCLILGPRPNKFTIKSTVKEYTDILE